MADMYWPFLHYLVSRPPLDHVQMSHPVGSPFSITVGQTTIMAIGRKDRNLKTLKIQSDSLQDLLQKCDWSPIRNSTLVEVPFEDLREPKGQDPEADHITDWILEVITNLPISIRRIHLKGAGGLKTTRKLRISDFSQCISNILDELSILNAGGSLTNDVTQFLCLNFKMLRQFNLSDGETDDQGFVGISELKGE